MGQRSQIYVRYANRREERKQLIAKYFGWNYGERMISRTRWGLEKILCNMENPYNTDVYACPEKVEILSRMFDVNFDMHDILPSCDIVKEWKELASEKSFNETVFKEQACNDGKLLIDILEKEVKYAFLDRQANPEHIMDSERYMSWDSGADWRTGSCMTEEMRETCEANIRYIAEHATLMTKEEVEEFMQYDYGFTPAPENHN